MSRLITGAGSGSPIGDVDLPDDRPFLWAPDASRVEVSTGDQVHPCLHRGQVWESPFVPDTGTRYTFVVDGTTVPDPRTRSQPDGVHAPSEWTGPRPGPNRSTSVTAAESSGASRQASVSEERPLDRAVIQEIHIGSFSEQGTFRGAIEHLDHLVELGVTHVELMPVAAFDGHHGWGYDGVDLFAPHPDYGSASDLTALVEECRGRGLSVLLDLVLNHLGPSGNYLSVTGPYFTDRYTTPWGDAVNLDGPGSDGVRRFLIDAACYWLEDIGFDGLRLDAVHALYDISAVPILEQLTAEVRALAQRTGRPRILIAESDRSDPRIVQQPPSGPGLDGVWVDDLHHCLHVEMTGECSGYYRDVRPGDLARALSVAQTHQGSYSIDRGRTIGRPVDGIDSSSFVVSLQNHDQIGNRARGERIHHLVGTDRAAAAAALTLLSPFSVLMFQGEEWMASTPFPYFSDHSGDLGEAIRQGRMHEFEDFGWAPEDVSDPQDPATFESARLDWNEPRHGEHKAALNWYRTLIDLRNEADMGTVRLPSTQEATVDDSLVKVRRGALTIIANLGEAPRRTDLPSGDTVLERGETTRGARVLELGSGSVYVTRDS